MRFYHRRLFVSFLLACPFALGLSYGESWYESATVGLEVGPTGAQWGHSDVTDTRYGSQFDGREIVRRTIAAHSDYLVMWVRDGDYAYYNSTLLMKAPGLGERDPLREAMDEAAKSNLPIIAYCVVQQGGHFLKEHPEWEMRGANGEPIGRFCYNSGYLEAMKTIVAEQLAYGIAGFHIDMVDQGFGPPYGCWCDHCRDLFSQQYDQPMPSGATWDEAWDRMLEFRYATSERFERALYAHIKSIRPDASVDFNYHGNPPFSFEVGQRPVQHAGNSDFVTGETGVWGFSALTVGLNAAFYRAAVPNQRVQVAMQRGVRMYHDQTTRPLNDLRWELLTLLSHGAFVTIVDKTGYDGWLDPEAYERFGAAFKEAHDKREHFGQPPVAEVGLYFSSRTRDWVGREQPGDFFQSFLGAHKAMVYEHIPYKVILDENADLDTLKQCPIILLPNVRILSEDEVARFRKYVEGGGNLIVLGLTGTHDRWGNSQDTSALEELVGARYLGPLDRYDNWVRFAQSSSNDLTSSVLNGIREDWPFLVRGPAARYEPRSAQAAGELLKPFHTKLHEEGRWASDWPLSADSLAGPAVLLNQVGNGKVLTLAASPDWATASEHHIVEARRLLRNAVRLLNPLPRLNITAPANVETVVTDDVLNRTLRIHFLGYNSTPQTTPPTGRPHVLPGLIEDAPLYRATIEFREAVESLECFNKSTTISRQNQRFDLLIDDIHEVIVCRY